MTKIITKTAEQKTNEWIKLHNAIKVHEELIPITGYKVSVKETYARNGGDTGYDFDILVVKYKKEKHIDKWEDKIFDTATLYTFKGMDIDKTLEPYEPSTYNFYAWIERHQDHVDAEAFHHWVGNNEFDQYFFNLYVDYLIDLYHDETLEYTERLIEPDYKEMTLAESIKQSFTDVFDEEIWTKVLTAAFNTENSGQGVWLVRSDSSFHEKGFFIPSRTDGHAFVIMVNSNIWNKVISFVKKEGFGLWNGSVCVGRGCANGKHVTMY